MAGSSSGLHVYSAGGNVQGSVELNENGTTQIEVLGYGFEEGESISIVSRPRGFDVVLGSATANAANAFHVTINLPTSFTLENAPFTVTASGDEGGMAEGGFILVDKVTGGGSTTGE